MQIAVRQSTEIIPLHDHSEWHWVPGSLDALLLDLASIDHVTEQSFLALGQKIHVFQGKACDISKLSGEVLQLLNGDGAENTLRQLQLLVERCSFWLSETQTKSVDICNLLNGVILQLSGLATPVAGLKKVIKTLHALRVSTRIEAAKGFASGAAVLARSLDELGSQAQAKVTEIFERTEALIPIINRSLDMEESTQASSIKIAVREVDSARKLLSEFMSTQVETGQWTDQLKSRSDQVNLHFGEIVAALQFQDITRQRLEHVRKALDSLGRHLERFSQRTDFSKDREAAGLFCCICQLQHDQLALAENEFLTAVDSLSENMQAMGANVVLMAEDTKLLFRATDACSDNRYSSVLEALQSIADCLHEAQRVHQEATSLLAEVSLGVQDVAGLVEEVEFVSEEMQLLAMNAAISAAHARKQGAGLDVIAQNIQLVAEEATHHALILADECGTITEHARQLEIFEKDTKSGFSSFESLLHDANAHMEVLDDSTRRLLNVVGHVDQNAKTLSQDVTSVVNTVDLKTPFQEKLKPALTYLASLGENTSSVVESSGGESLEHLFDELELCYTMASERHIHERFMEKKSTESSVSDILEKDLFDSCGHDLGDNVDLF